MLEIKNLYASIDGKPILKGIDLELKAGQIHAMMGPNGSGKSTLAKALAGDPMMQVTRGEIRYLGKDLLSMEPEERALAGFFMAFQYPVEIPGVNNASFLRMAYNTRLKQDGKEEMDPLAFSRYLREKMALVEIDPSYMTRAVNYGFSGGEKKRNEILQMAVLQPTLAVLDETDSGLDIDALRVVARGINRLRQPNNAILLITHYQRLLDYIKPDVVHIIQDGRIVRSGDKSLALELEKKGYGWLKEVSKS